jgi:tetratricopeptide (TPR) repeat protein
MLENYDHALEHYTESFQIKSKFLPTHHPSIATALRNIGMIHEKKGATTEALRFYKQASDMNRST